MGEGVRVGDDLASLMALPNFRMEMGSLLISLKAHYA